MSASRKSTSANQTTMKQKNQPATTPKKRGRQAADGATGVVRITVLVTPEQRSLLPAFGGSVFVREAIETERARRGIVREV